MEVQVLLSGYLIAESKIRKKQGRHCEVESGGSSTGMLPKFWSKTMLGFPQFEEDQLS
jgi:hypothetical protein